MALSFEESKKLLSRLATTPATIPITAEPAMMVTPVITATPTIADTGIMTLAEGDYGMVAAYSEWEKSDKYLWYTDINGNDEYYDSKLSTIDENKNIMLDSSQVNISQEENSQFISFEMPRYYDGFDLMKTEIWIHYLTSDKYHGASKAVNVSFDTSTIKFSWLVDGKATHAAGNLKFEIRAIGVNSEGDAYVWKSRTYDKMNVLQSLIDDNDTIVLDDSWIQELVTDIANNIGEQIAAAELSGFVTDEEMKNSLDSALANYYTISETESYIQDQIDAIPEVDLSNHALKSEIPTQVSELKNDAGYLTSIPEEYVTDSELIAKAYLTSIPEEYITEEELAAKGYLTEHQSLEGLATETYVSEKLGTLADDAGAALTVEQYVVKKMSEVDVSDQLGELGADDEGNNHTVVSYVNEKIEEIDISDKLGTLADDEGNELTVEAYVNKKVSEVDVSGQLVDYAKADSVYSKTQTDDLIDDVETDVATNAADISTLKTAVEGVKTELSTIDKSAKYTYEATYGTVENEDGSTQEYMFTLWETESGKDPSVKSRFQIMGGGSSGGGVEMIIKYIDGYKSPMTVTADDKVIVRYEFTGKDSAGDTDLDATASWKVGNRVVKTQDVSTGVCEVDLTEFLTVGTSTVLLTLTHATGSVATKSWKISIIDMYLESAFDDTRGYTANESVSLTFTPYGSIDKTVHFVMDGEEIATKTSSAAASGLSDAYLLAAQNHGTHLVEMYMTATINNNTITSNKIVKDIIWYDENADTPVIGCVNQKFTARQYEATTIKFTVLDPSTETPTVTLRSTYENENGETVEEYFSELKMTSNIGEWQYKTAVIGKHYLTITCGDVVKPLEAEIVDIGISVNPITEGLIFDFNPVGYSNDDTNRLWSYGEDIAMTVSSNFDWVNGGYQIDKNGDQCFCIKAGTSAEINYEMFGDDAKLNGKQMKLIFKTENVANTEAVFLSCVSDATGSSKIGLEMKAQEATIYAKGEQNLPLPYSEEDIIEFEFNITASTETPCMVMGYEDGVSTRPLVYDDTYDFQQHKDYRKTISLGSPDCDLYIYRFKLYGKSLSDKDILNNFIADARSAEEMIKRYERNQIYQNGILTPEYLAEAQPHLRIIKIEAPRFTEDKDDKVRDTIIEFIYKNGDPILDNFVAYDCVHSGQGTSSNNYGPAGRNLDLIMKTYKDYGNNPYIILGDGSQVKKVSLTRNSVPVNYFNVKVNIASSENANNALLAKRYNDYNPYKRPFVRPVDTLEDHYTAEEIAEMTEEQKSKILAGYQKDADAEIACIKDTMEFYNCVIFIKESDPDVSTHKEFADCNWHFYAIGNVGDSKKTDKTRLTDPDDIYECILEVMDNTLPNSTMPTGKVDEETGAPVFPISSDEWVAGNSAYDALHADKFDEKKATDKENGLADTYGWRYIYEYDDDDDANDAIKAYVEQQWKDFYAFVVTSSDEDFKTHLGDWCVLDSVLYYYLFTLRYTMTDNHAKNSFWHYGKSNDLDSDGNPIRKWDLCFDYDNDTALGIDNYGRMTYRYGYEEIDYVDGTSDWVWNAPNHVFFMRLRKLFDEELCTLYTKLESLNAWSSTSLINQFNEWQEQFPEELWRTDIERKYIRTYTSSYINGPAKVEFLKERANGRKKYQRSQFERGQEKYMSSKFGGTVASSDDIILRCSVPNTTLAVPANFDMTLTPYAYIYLNVKYNTSPPIRVRAVPNQKYTIKYDAELADIIEIYSASCLKDIGDLSACYLINGDFSNARKIRELTLGNGTDGYDNTNSMTLGLGSNDLLTKIDIQNMSGLVQSLDLSGLKNLEEVYAYGTNIGGVIFADAGNVDTVEIPDVGTIQMKNLHYLTDDGFNVTGFDKLTRLVSENSQLDLVSTINSSPNLYQVRLTGVDWKLESTALLERLYGLAGVTNTGANTDRSVLSGTVFVPTIKEKQLNDYREAWPDLTINYNTFVNQFAVTFMNPDGKVLDVQYVDKGSKPVDPTTREVDPIATPTLESTVSTDYTFTGWDSTFIDTFKNTTIYATYSESVRQYTVTYMANGEQLQEPIVADYGTVVTYDEELPTYQLEEGAYKYYLFSGWDQSGFVDGNKIINAVFDSCEYTDGYYDELKLKDMRPVEVYMLTKLSANKVLTLTDYLSEDDSITLSMGSDLFFEDIEEVTLIDEETVFTGTNYIDTGVALLDEDRDFVIAIDYKMASGNSTSATLAQCFSDYYTSGFALTYNNGAKLVWGSSSVSASAIGSREMIVLRHKKGENGVHVYVSNTAGTETYYTELDGMHAMDHKVNLVFGCCKMDDGAYERFAKGTVYWSKVWYADLGDSACRKLAYWPHEEMGFDVCFEVGEDENNPTVLKRYALSDGSGNRSSMTLISTGVLQQPVVMEASPATDHYNEGGWAEYDLNEYLNTRVLNAFQDEWRQLLKQVRVKSTIGNQSTDLCTADSYIFVPSICEIYGNVESQYATDEYRAEGTPINQFSTTKSVICYNSDGVAVDYWTRSPSLTWDDYLFRVTATGTVQPVTSPYNTYYARIMVAL